jgi:hypothetical protein
MNEENQPNIPQQGGFVGSSGMGIQSPPKSSNKKIVIGIILGIIVIFIGAVAVLAARIWDPTWSPFRSSPETVVHKAFSKMAEVDAMHSKLTLKGEIRSPEGAGSFSLVAEGDSDSTDPKELKSQSVFDFSLNIQGVKMFFVGEARAIGEALYFKIDTVPLPITAFLSKAGIDLDQWKGKWISFDPKDLGMSIGPDSEEMIEIEKEILELLTKYPVLQAKQEFSDKSIEGKKMYHYLLTLDPENTKYFMADFIESIGQSMGSMYSGISTEETQKIDEAMDEMFEVLGEVDFEIYIGKKDFLIYKVAGEKLIEIPDEPSRPGGEVDLNFQLESSRFNQPIDIQAPEQSTSILELFGPLMQMSMGMNQAGADARIKSDVIQLRTEAELIYADYGNYDNLCIGGGLNRDHSTMIADIENDIKTQQKGTLALSCYA